MPRARNYVWGCHLKERLEERFHQILTDEEWKIDNLINTTICQLINRSKIQRAYLNSSRFMNYIYETHGYDNYEFLFVEDLKLILVVRGKSGKHKIIRTVMYADPDLFSSRPKFIKNTERKSQLGKVKSYRKRKGLSEVEALFEYMEEHSLDISDIDKVDFNP